MEVALCNVEPCTNHPILAVVPPAGDLANEIHDISPTLKTWESVGCSVGDPDVTSTISETVMFSSQFGIPGGGDIVVRVISFTSRSNQQFAVLVPAQSCPVTNHGAVHW